MSTITLVILFTIAVTCNGHSDSDTSPPQYAYEYMIKDDGNHHDGSYINRKVAIRYIGGGTERESSIVHHPDHGVSEQRQVIIRNGLDNIGSGSERENHIRSNFGKWKLGDIGSEDGNHLRRRIGGWEHWMDNIGSGRHNHIRRNYGGWNNNWGYNTDGIIRYGTLFHRQGYGGFGDDGYRRGNYGRRGFGDSDGIRRGYGYSRRTYGGFDFDRRGGYGYGGYDFDRRGQGYGGYGSNRRSQGYGSYGFNRQGQGYGYNRRGYGYGRYD